MVHEVGKVEVRTRNTPRASRTVGAASAGKGFRTAWHVSGDVLGVEYRTRRAAQKAADRLNNVKGV